MRHRSQALFLLTSVLLVAAAVFPQPVLAQDTGRILGGHTFIPSGQMHQPFVASYVRSGTGLSVFTMPLLDVGIGGTNVELVEGNVLYLTQQFEYQLALKDWLAIRVGGSGLGRGGIEGSSVLIQGVNWGFGGGIGAMARLWRGDTAMLSTSFDVNGGSAYGINLIDFVERLIEEGWTEDTSIVESVTAAFPRFGVHGAWAPKPWLGMTGYVEGGWAQTWVRSVKETDSVIAAGLTVGVDFNELGGTPIGLLFTLESDPFLQQGVNMTESLTTLGGGVYYTGASDLGLGLEVTSITTPQGYDDRRTTVMQFSTTLQYYF